MANGEGEIGLPAAVAALQGGASALTAVERGIGVVEADPSIHSVGRGGIPNLLGEVECDAAIMNGRTLQVGVVGALQGYLNAISVARQVMERLPHAVLAGDGARRFAAEIGARKADMVTEEARAFHRQWLEKHLSDERLAAWPEGPLAEYAWITAKSVMAKGTTIYLALDEQGRMAGGTSTSGWAGKYPGRLGDSPIIGAGLYVDERYGACGCTHTGEMTIRLSTAHAVVQSMKHGATVEEACRDAAQEIVDLKEGFLGPVAIHAIDAKGNAHAVSTRDLGEKIKYCVWFEGTSQPECRRTPAL
ncbi:MAG: N(4)-(beta-N-acetylglucosaminyl)-L-asparaginase [Candidatus Eisenbacteria bacterium]|uniref:N(4)-(Beta-N-acetylglucosaminyl)-L-asparaginase n=1 Tax=Eiseniibacteriota bacterium TaxID=2212470 RepID=A0A948RXH9_UNCEI|nr:N(4)-(beta-N-acetylglucosaminyl)-L-asparaginase [Candidatus Eisenbacteria bacterium]MBU1948517.1 N(4)-(beta-N-acetylglucosaminyl)-L-asparaginase [Candidatus Eisenbacteria bacterium]MBU2692670.1 N(4)-(beta-N-acetylglucosaminyl)-L-asparaginase [Candidatus Eisenbacteria bacterium]